MRVRATARSPRPSPPAVPARLPVPARPSALRLLPVTALALLAAACGDDLAAPSDAASDAALADAAPVAWPGLQLGGPLVDEILALGFDGDQLVYAGYRDGARGQSSTEPGGDAVGFVHAVGLDGAPRWQRDFDSPGADVVEALSLADDLVIAGRTTGALGGVPAGQFDAFVARLARDGTGAPVIAQLGDERPQHPVGLARDAAGGLLLAGYDDVHVVGGAVVDFENPMTARLRPDLGLDVFRRGATAEPDAHLALAAAGPAGELFVGGYVAAGVRRGPYVQRLDAHGDAVWTRRLGTVGFDAVTALAVGPDGLVYAAGATSELLGARAYGQQDLFVAVLDPTTGTLVRALQAGTDDVDFPRDLAIAPDGTIYVAAETLGALPGAANQGEFDLLVVRFAADGTWTGAWQHGSPADETLHALALTPGALFVAGYTAGALLPSATPAGQLDGFLLRVPLDALLPP